jgi:branched-chain amino acid transport system ATP-binding protein
VIKLENVYVNYGKVAALSAVSLTAMPGQIYAVLGANGAGKTSLLRAILGLTEAKGAILFDGANISRLPIAERVRRGIALVPEGRRLFPDFTVAENLRIGACNRTDRAEIGRDIEEVCEIFPILRERYHQRSESLSGGEGQMLAIGRALLARPKLLMLDEPSVGLMPLAVAKIFEIIGAIPRSKGITVLLVEQNARKALGIASRAAVLELGRVVLEDTAASIADDARVQEAYLGGSSQAARVQSP